MIIVECLSLIHMDDEWTPKIIKKLMIGRKWRQQQNLNIFIKHTNYDEFLKIHVVAGLLTQPV